MESVRIAGRSSSHFTRTALIFAEELDVPYVLEPIYDMTATTPANYGGNPALKLPSLLSGQRSVFGAQNVCRALQRLSQRPCTVIWPEMLEDDLLANAQELVQHAMSAQVQIVFGTVIAGLPEDNIYFNKARAGFESSLEWLDRRLLHILQALPHRDLSYLEVGLFCLLDHLELRPTLSLAPYPNLERFRAQFAERPSALATPYRFDRPAD